MSFAGITERKGASYIMEGLKKEAKSERRARVEHQPAGYSKRDKFCSGKKKTCE